MLKNKRKRRCYTSKVTNYLLLKIIFIILKSKKLTESVKRLNKIYRKFRDELKDFIRVLIELVAKKNKLLCNIIAIKT